MLKKYNVELEGQIEFYEQYLKIVNPELNYEDIKTPRLIQFNFSSTDFAA